MIVFVQKCNKRSGCIGTCSILLDPHHSGDSTVEQYVKDCAHSRGKLLNGNPTLGVVGSKSQVKAVLVRLSHQLHCLLKACYSTGLGCWKRNVVYTQRHTSCEVPAHISLMTLHDCWIVRNNIDNSAQSKIELNADHEGSAGYPFTRLSVCWRLKPLCEASKDAFSSYCQCHINEALFHSFVIQNLIRQNIHSQGLSETVGIMERHQTLARSLKAELSTIVTDLTSHSSLSFAAGVIMNDLWRQHPTKVPGS